MLAPIAAPSPLPTQPRSAQQPQPHWPHLRANMLVYVHTRVHARLLHKHACSFTRCVHTVRGMVAGAPSLKKSPQVPARRSTSSMCDAGSRQSAATCTWSKSAHVPAQVSAYKSRHLRVVPSEHGRVYCCRTGAKQLAQRLHTGLHMCLHTCQDTDLHTCPKTCRHTCLHTCLLRLSFNKASSSIKYLRNI